MTSIKSEKLLNVCVNSYVRLLKNKSSNLQQQKTITLALIAS